MMVNQPFTSKRAPIYKDVPDEKWNDWRWQLSNRINTPRNSKASSHSPRAKARLYLRHHLFRVDITPYFISLIDPQDPNDPIRMQVVPTEVELTPFTAMMEDSSCRRSSFSCAQAGSPLS